MDWFFDGIGTFFIGLLFGGAGGSAITWRVISSKRVKQTQTAGKNARQSQVGGDQNTRGKKKQ